MRRALTIAGSDSGGGAGIQADLKTFAAHGVYGTSAITAVTAQNTLGVAVVAPLAADLVTAQIEAVVSDIGADAAKTGMLPTPAIVDAVAAAVEDLQIPFLVVDPVIAAGSGDRLVAEDALEAMKASLCPRAFLLTPNIAEAEMLAGIPIRTEDDRREAARRIARLGVRAVLITGAHFPSRDIVDLLYASGTFVEFRHDRLPIAELHGTGCTLAASIAAQLALGRALTDAVGLAQRYVAGAIAHALEVGRGRRPVDHFWAASRLRD